ncbi:MAG: hypothetical protein JWR16_3209, partial [Nevskia sp.]|nr:hypothetical protein [Nevskia sp.]
ADIWAAAATMLGLGKDQLPILKIAAAARPRMLHLQFALESVAATCNDIATALEANARLGDGAEETLRRIGLLLNARKFAACLELVEARLSTLPHDHQLFPTAICFGIVAADKIVQPDRADNLVAILEKLPNNAEHLASLKYSRAISHKGLASDDAIAALGIAWKVSQTSLGLGIQYFLALPVDTPDAAAKAIAVAQDVRKLSLLPSDAELHLAQAYVTTSNWPALLTLGEEGTARFPLQARFVAVAAFALDKLGRTAEARSMLDDLIQKSLDDSLAVHTYVRIAARSGFINDAIRVVEQIVGQEIDKRKKLGYLRMLHELVASREPQCARAEQIAWQMGQLSDHEDESEEGTFLTLYMTSTLSPQVYVPPERQTDFRRRLGDFQKRFPSSRLLSGYSMPDNPTLADLERMIASFDPGFRERHEQKQKLEKMLDRGELPIPYAWRPRLALENVSDTPTLWELAKTSQAIPQKYRLGMVGADWTPAPESSIAGRIPLLDLLALLVVHDLGLFEVLFEVFGTIAVAQGVFEELRRVTGPMTASWGRKTCLSIQAELKKRFDNVRCPTVAAKDDDDNDWSARLATDEIKKLAASGEYLLYTDDAIFRVYADVPTSFQPVFCTLDLLAIADARGLMPIERLAAAYSDLCKWNVGIVIADRYLFANIPNVVMSAKNLGDAIDVLRNDAKLGPMLNGIWDISRPYSDIHAGTARLCARWLEDVGNRIETITALIGVWHIKVKLHRDVAKMSPLDQLALMMVSAGVLVQAKTAETSRRLWKVYLEVVAFEHGNRMDEAREREAIRLLGTCMARSAFGLSTKREVLEAIADFIRSGLTEGTAVDQWYGDAYNAEWTKQALESDARARNAERHTKA